jgi:hypothetical protein
VVAGRRRAATSHVARARRACHPVRTVPWPRAQRPRAPRAPAPRAVRRRAHGVLPCDVVRAALTCEARREGLGHLLRPLAPLSRERTTPPRLGRRPDPWPPRSEPPAGAGEDRRGELESIGRIAQPRCATPPLAPTQANRAAQTIAPASTSPELELQRRPPPGAADRRRRKPPRPFLGPKSSRGELLRLFPNFPGRDPRRSRRNPARPPSAGTPGTQLRAPHSFQGDFCKPGTFP